MTKSLRPKGLLDRWVPADGPHARTRREVVDSRRPTTGPMPDALVYAAALLACVLAGFAVASDLAIALIASGVVVTAALIAYATLHHPAVLGVVIVAGFALQPAGKLFVSPYLGPVKDAVSLTALAVTLLVLVLGRVRVKDPRLVVLVVAIVLLYLLNTAGGHGAGWAAATRLAVGSFGLLVVGYYCPSPIRAWRIVAQAVVLVAIVESILGVAQQVLGRTYLVTQVGYAFGTQVRETADGQLRSFGTLDEPFSYATLVLFGLVVATQSRPTALRNAWIVPLLVVGVVLSYDRTAIVLLLVVALLWLARVWHWYGVAVLLGVSMLIATCGVLAALWGFSDSGSRSSVLLTLNGRTQTWVQVIRDPGDLWAGRGAGEIGSGLARSQAGFIVEGPRYEEGKPPVAADNSNLTSIDNSYLAILADVGLPGLLLVVSLGAVAVGQARLRFRGNSAGWCVAGIVAVLAIDSLTRTSLTAFPVGYIGLYLVGLGLGAVYSAAYPVPPGRHDPRRRRTQRHLDPAAVHEARSRP